MDTQRLNSPFQPNGSFVGLFWASVGMFCGCYVAGLVPLTLSLSENRIKTMSVFGAGLLVGTALSVIIPEGLHMVIEHDSNSHYDDHHHHHHEIASQTHEQRNLAHLHASTAGDRPPPKTQGDSLFIANDILPGEISNSNSKKAGHDSSNSYNKQGPIPGVVLDKVAGADLEDNPLKREAMEGVERMGPHSYQSEEGEGHEGGEAANVIGLSLVTGFVFMLIIDHFAVGSHSHSPSMSHSQYTHISDAENAHKNELNTNNRSKTKLTTTLGLLIHAAADGIAMAAVSTTQKSDLQFLVFVAIMLHKFPASFGLVSFLLSEKIDKQRVRKHLMAFSLAAPVGAFATYLLMVLPGIGVSGGSETGLFANFSGKALLFSAGTFLYVATIHILPNIQLSSAGGHFSTWHVIVLVGGAFCPTFLNVFHHH